MKKILIALAAAAALVTGPAYAADVSVDDNFFDPENVAIDVGDSVTWTNNGSNPHTVTEENEEFDSGTMAASQTFSHTFNDAGTYEYFCEIHGSSMSGTVTVQGGSSPAPTPTGGGDGGSTSGGTDDGDTGAEDEEIARTGVSARTGVAGLAFLASGLLAVSLARSRSRRASARP